MRRMDEALSIARKREREKRTISQMVALYCAKNHAAPLRTETAHCGQALCPECAEIERYAVQRTQQCTSMAVKTTCEECGKHCYRRQQRQQIRAIMRYAGPRMIAHHPVAAIRHLLGR